METKTLEVRWADPEELEVHPLNAVLVPDMTPEELETLKESMRLKGFLETEAVRVLRGTNLVVDGKNRLRAARELSLRVAVVEVDIPDEELPYFIFSTAYHRRDIPTGIRAANAAFCYSLLEEAAAERRRLGLKFYKQDMCQTSGTNSWGSMSPNYEKDDLSILGRTLLSLYEKEGGRRKEFLRKFFKIAERDLKVALWLRRFLPEDFEALRKGEITMAEAREIYRKARPEMEARGALIEEWRDLVKRIPELSRISVLLGYLDQETQRELLSALKAGVSGNSGDQEDEKGLRPEDLMEIPQVRELVERAEALEEEKRRLEERLRELSEAESRMEALKLEKAHLEKRLRELEEMLNREPEKEVVTVVDPGIEAEMERLRARLSELEAELEEARAEAESFSQEKDRLEEERRKLFEANEKLREELREARRHIQRLVKGIDPEKKRAKKRFIDKITRHYERKLEKLREKNRELKELLVEAKTENARLKALLGGRALKVVPVKLVHMFMAMTGLLQNREFREMVVGLVKEAEVDAGELLDLVTDLQEAAAGLGAEILSAVRERREQLEAAVEADDFAKGLKETLRQGLPPGTANGGKEKGGGNSAPPKKITLKLRRISDDRVSDRTPEAEGSQVGGALEGRDLSSSQGEHKEAGASAGTADSG